MCDSPQILHQTMILLNKFVEHQGAPHFVAGVSLTFSELHMLQTIADNPYDNITELAEKMGCTKGRVSKIVSRLCMKKLVEKYKNEGNDKDVLLQLTQKGQEINRCHKEADKQLVRRIEDFLESVSANEKKEIYEYLKISEAVFDH